MKYDRVLKFNKLLKIDAIKYELESFTEGTTPGELELVGRNWLCCLNKEGERNILNLSNHSFTITKTTDNMIHRFGAYEDLTIRGEVLERRDNGVIYTMYIKRFSDSKRYGGIVLSDYYEERYVLSDETLDKLNDFNMTNTSLLQSILVLLKRCDNRDIKRLCDYSSSFESRMNTYIKSPFGGRALKDSAYPTVTLVNGEDVSHLYDNEDSSNKIYVIIDLYNGIINHNTEATIRLIHNGLVSTDAFGLRELKGINAKEEEIVGETKIIPSLEYTKYLSDYLYYVYGYQGSLDLSRGNLLNAINYKMHGIETAKWTVAKTVGMRYEEFDKLDFDEQQKLIMEHKKKK